MSKVKISKSVKRKAAIDLRKHVENMRNLFSANNGFCNYKIRKIRNNENYTVTLEVFENIESGAYLRLIKAFSQNIVGIERFYDLNCDFHVIKIRMVEKSIPKNSDLLSFTKDDLSMLTDSNYSTETTIEPIKLNSDLIRKE